MNTDWKSLQIYNPYIHGPEKANKLVKSKITKMEENLNETVKHGLK